MKNINRILFLAEGQLGDAMVITPALRAVKETYPEASVSILLFYRRRYTEKSNFEDAIIRKSNFNGTAEVFKNNPYVDEVLELDRGALRTLKGLSRVKAEFRNIKTLRRGRYDTIICSFPQDRFSWYSYAAGAKIRIGERKQGLGFLLTHRLDVNQNKEGVLKYFLELLRPINVTTEKYNTIFNIEETDVKQAELFSIKNSLNNAKYVIGVHPGSSQHDRKWLPERFAETMNYFGNIVGCRIILFYSDFDIPFINEIKKSLHIEILEVKTSTLSALAAYMKICSLCITHSSGPRHLAAAIGEPTIGVFDKMDGVRWGIYDENMHPVIKTKIPCKACPADRCLGIIPDGEPYSSYCMRDIPVEDVINAAKKMLKID